VISLIVIAIFVALLIYRVIYEIRDVKKKEFLAKLMDCEYICIMGNDYFVPKN
jgi:hypothetical protein